jgi:hypothetical protein
VAVIYLLIYSKGESMDELRLREYFKFDQGDLLANRSGKFSEKQLESLKEWRRSMIYSNLVVVAVFLSLMAWMGAAIYGNWGNVQKVGPIAPWFIVLFLLVVRQLWVAFRKVEPKVEKAEGPVSVVKVERQDKERRTSWHYELRVGMKNFRVQPAVEELFEQGDVYAVYYYTYNNTEILSMEFIEKRRS